MSELIGQQETIPLSKEEILRKVKGIKSFITTSLTSECFNALIKLGYSPEDINLVLEDVFGELPRLHNYIELDAIKGISIPGNGVIATSYNTMQDKIKVTIETIDKIIKQNDFKNIGFFGVTGEANSDITSSSLYLGILNKLRETNPGTTFFVMDNMYGKNSVGGDSDKFRTPEKAFEDKYNFDLVIVGANHLLSLKDGNLVETLLQNATRNNYNVFDINTSMLYKTELPAQASNDNKN